MAAEAEAQEIARGLSNSFSGPVDMTRCNATALRELFQRQHRFLNYFFSNLEYEAVSNPPLTPGLMKRRGQTSGFASLHSSWHRMTQL